MTKKDYQKIGQAVKNYIREREKIERSPGWEGWNDTEYLLDELCYAFEEDNEKFNEVKFRQFVLDIK